MLELWPPATRKGLTASRLGCPGFAQGARLVFAETKKGHKPGAFCPPPPPGKQEALDGDDSVLPVFRAHGVAVVLDTTF